jgi:hypothetical protein
MGKISRHFEDLRLMQVKRKQKFTMKTKLQILIVAFFIIFSMTRASAQAMINPTTGLPMPPPPEIDTVTGLPADGSPPFKDSSGTPTWIDPTWVDPGKVLPSVDFKGFPLSEVANQMRKQFTNFFDIILPADGSVDPTAYNASLQLNNVRASEVFSAMNMQFELQRTPLRWELTANGMRPTVLLRYLPQLVPPKPPAPPPPPQTRKVFYVGDMLDEFPGTQAVSQGTVGANDDGKLRSIADMIDNAYDATGVQRGKVDIYSPGQLLIVSGTPEQVDLAEQTLRALKEKAEFENSHKKK